MKNYRMLFPILAVLLMFVGIYLMISRATDTRAEVKRHLEEAELYKEHGLYQKASECYSQAVELDDNPEYYFRAIDMCNEVGEQRIAATWAEDAHAAFPTNVEAYERLLKVRIDQRHYDEAYELLDEFDGRKLSSPVVEAYRKQMETLFYDDYSGYEEVSIPSNGYVKFRNTKDLWGLASAKGGTRVGADYLKMGYFASKMVAVCDQEETWYMMNASGVYQYNLSKLFDGEISDVGMLSNGLLPICIDGKYIYTNMITAIEEDDDTESGLVMTVPVVSDEKYDFAGSFLNGVAAIREGNDWYVIRTDFTKVNDKAYTEILLDERGVCCSKGIYFAKSGGKYKMYNKEGVQIGDKEFDDARLFASLEPAAVKVGDKWGFIETDGSFAIEPEYDDAKSFACGLAPVLVDEKWGYINPEKEFIVPNVLYDAQSFTEKGTAFVKETYSLKCYKLYKYNSSD